MQEQITDLLNRFHLSDYTWNIILIGLSLVAGFFIRIILGLFFRKKADETNKFSFFKSVIRHLGTPVNFFLPLFLFNLLLPLMRLPADWRERLSKLVEIFLIVVFAWIVIR